jgi:hypothetical protein
MIASAVFHKTVIKSHRGASKLSTTVIGRNVRTPQSTSYERPPVKALKKARKLIETRSETPEAATLSALVVALESEKPFPLTDLYQLDYGDFELALEVLQEWRLDRYYMSKVRLLDLSVQLGELNKEEKKAVAPAPAKV